MIEIEIPSLDKIKQSQWMKVLQYTPEQETEVSELISQKIWITAERKQMFVRAMTTKHIKNCINCWHGKGKMKIPSRYLGGKTKWLKIFEEELWSRS